MITVLKIKEGNSSSQEMSCCGDYQYIAQFDNMFPDDKVYIKSDDFVLILDGMVLNKKQMLKNDSSLSWGDFLINLYKTKGEQFFAQLRGSFVGALYDVKKDKWIFFKDQLGTIPMFFSSTNHLFVSSDIADLYHRMKSCGIALNLDPIGIKMMFDEDVTMDGYTICQEIRRVHPGCYLVFENGIIKEKQFYEIKRNEFKLSCEEEYLDLIDESFQNAIKKQFSKDDEYGYKVITLLSGGIDSRIMVWVSHQLGWEKQLNLTFANSGSYDETIARQIAKDLRHEWLFKPLDDGNFLYNVDDCSNITGGNLTLARMAHIRSITSLIDHTVTNLGAIHSGSRGEFLKGVEAMGGHCNKDSNHYLDYFKKLGISSILDYSDPEVCTIINSDLFNTWGVQQTPFVELDFFETTLKIPAALRLNEHIYEQWICKRHPDANKYIWATTGLPYGSKRYNPKVPFVNCYLHQLPNYIGYKMGRHGFGMNPWNKFYENNKGLKSFFDSYAQYLEAIKDEKIRIEIKNGLDSDVLSRKFKAVTVLSAVKLFFS